MTEAYTELEEMETFWFFRLLSLRAYNSAYDSDFQFSLGGKCSYDSDYNSRLCFASEKPVLKGTAKAPTADLFSLAPTADLFSLNNLRDNPERYNEHMGVPTPGEKNYI